jgi:hypothetical protein
MLDINREVTFPPDTTRVMSREKWQVARKVTCLQKGQTRLRGPIADKLTPAKFKRWPSRDQQRKAAGEVGESPMLHPARMPPSGLGGLHGVKGGGQHLPRRDPAMAADWYYRKNGQQLGPLESAELRRLADTGVVTPDDMVWRQGAKQWAKASSVKGLFAEPIAKAADSPTPNAAAASPPSTSAAPTPSASPTLVDDDWWQETSSADEDDRPSLPSPYSDDGIAYTPSAPRRRRSERRDFPALRMIATIVRAFALLALLVAVLCGIVAIVNARNEEYSMVGIGIGFSVVFLLVSLLYLAAAECIALALYLTTLLEDIRDK